MSNVSVYSFADSTGLTKYVDSSSDFLFTGTWSSTGTYTDDPLMAAQYGSALYMCILDNVGDNPQRVPTRARPSSWSIMSLLYEYQSSGTQTSAEIIAEAAYALAESGTNAAWAAYYLAQIGTNSGTAALNSASTAQSTANTAFNIAVIGTNTGSAAYALAGSAYSLAGSAAIDAASALSAANGAFSAAVVADATADAAYALAQIGTNTGTAALSSAASAQSTANSAFNVAIIGTNTGTAALNAAATAQSTADSAFNIAVIGTNTGTAAYTLATDGSNLAWQAYTLASAGGAGADATARATADAAYALAQIGTNTGTAAYTLATNGSNLARSLQITYWDTIIVKSANQDVTNNATPQADSELFFAVVLGGIYEVEFHLLYCGNSSTGDYRGRFSANASTTVMGFYQHLNASFVNTFVSQNVTAPFPNPDMICGCDTLAAVRTAYMRFQLVAAASENVAYQFANSAASSGITSRTALGSTLRVKRLV